MRDQATALHHAGDEAVTTARNMYAGLELALQALALPYVGHPDYRPEWAPEVS